MPSHKWLSIFSLTFLLLTANALSQNQLQKYNTNLTPEQIAARKEAIRDFPVTRWIDSEGRKPLTYSEWQSRKGQSSGPLVMELVAQSGTEKRAADYLVVVASDIYGAIAADIDVYLADLALEGFSTEVYSSTQGTPQELRTFLAAQYQDGIVGCLMIGDLPVIWYETECWDEKEYELFPCDYYYMDLNGTFVDSDANGFYDTHTGDIAPEIWFGRLYASTLLMGGSNEISLLHTYFAKNHDYREKKFIPNYRGLMFVDDDWSVGSEYWDANMAMAYCFRHFEYDIYRTVDTAYERYLGKGHEFVQVCVHSSPWAHYFSSPAGGGVTTNTEIKSMDPPATFYNLFACSNCSYVENDNMGGWYIFGPDHGLAAVGSTKTGSMLDFEFFYEPFGNGATIGESLRDWFAVHASWGMEPWMVCWFYGMTLQGDPTLKRNERRNVEIVNDKVKRGTQGAVYYDQIQADGGGGTPPYDWTILSGTLPPGVSFNDSTATFIGFAQLKGEYPLTISARDFCEPNLADTSVVIVSVLKVCGDVDNDDDVDILDIVYLIDNKFKSGPRPAIWAACDVNSDGPVNVLDIIFLIDYKYKGGPNPYCWGVE